jgi:hypothetical protein
LVEPNCALVWLAEEPLLDGVSADEVPPIEPLAVVTDTPPMSLPTFPPDCVVVVPPAETSELGPEVCALVFVPPACPPPLATR